MTYLVQNKAKNAVKGGCTFPFFSQRERTCFLRDDENGTVNLWTLGAGAGGS